MRIALFLTTGREAARELLRRVRAAHPQARLCAFVRDDDRAALGADLAGCEVRRDKPAGGRLAFVRALRRERFDRLWVAWHGGERFQPLRLVALVAGARLVIAVDERGRERAVRWFLPWSWAGHALRRAAATDARTAARAAAGLYRWTVGAAVAGLALLAFRIRRAPPR